MRSVNLLVLLVSQLTYSELIISAISDMEKLLETNKRIIEDLDSFILREERRIIHLKRNFEISKKEQELAMADVPNYVGNPITAFKLIYRLTTDLSSIQKGIDASADYIKALSSLPDLVYPSEDDVLAAAAAVARVRSTYDFNVTDLAEWKHNGVGTPMSMGECYALGRALSDQTKYKDSLSWMHEALRKYQWSEHQDITEIDILESIAYTNYLLHDNSAALAWTKRILELDPNHPRALVNTNLFQTTNATNDLHQENIQVKKDSKEYLELCRGKVTVPSSVTKSLTCRYMWERHPFLRLAPLKQEQLYRAPDVFLYHQVLSDHEIAQIQEIARPKLKQSTVISTKAQKLEGKEPMASLYRTGKTAFIGNHEWKGAPRLLQRIGDMTGLDLTSSEALQVVDYGVGGHYGPHSDYVNPDTHYTFANKVGNRIATVLFYLTDVALGGATVFPKLGLSVPPARGSALHWTNLNPAGEGDVASLHASCPVITGSKWISTKWLHEAGQELIKPCGLQYQAENIQWNITKPVPSR